MIYTRKFQLNHRVNLNAHEARNEFSTQTLTQINSYKKTGISTPVFFSTSALLLEKL